MAHGSVWLKNICRFRPLNSKELEAGDESVVSFPDTQNDREVSLLMTDKTEKGKGEKKERKFTFDKILKPTVTQSQVYDATAKNIVKGENQSDCFILLNSFSHRFNLLFRCSQWVQWDYIRLWPDLLRQDAHNGGQHPQRGDDGDHP